MAKGKLSKEDAKEIRRLWWDEELSYKQIAPMFGVCPQNIWGIVQNKVYRDKDYTPPSKADGRRRMKRGGKSQRHLTDDDVFSIFRMWNSGRHTVQEIADSLDATLSAVENILYGQSYRDVSKKAKALLGIGRVVRGGTTRVLTSSEMHTILKLYYSGLPARNVAKLVGRPESTVDKVLYGERYRETVRQIKIEMGVLSGEVNT